MPESAENSTHMEYMGDGYSVRIQHCVVCDEYLGVWYPSDYCRAHDPNIPKDKK